MGCSEVLGYESCVCAAIQKQNQALEKKPLLNVVGEIQKQQIAGTGRLIIRRQVAVLLSLYLWPPGNYNTVISRHTRWKMGLRDLCENRKNLKPRPNGISM